MSSGRVELKVGGPSFRRLSLTPRSGGRDGLTHTGTQDPFLDLISIYQWNLYSGLKILIDKVVNILP